MHAVQWRQASICGREPYSALARWVYEYDTVTVFCGILLGQCLNDELVFEGLPCHFQNCMSAVYSILTTIPTLSFATN